LYDPRQPSPLQHVLTAPNDAALGARRERVFFIYRASLASLVDGFCASNDVKLDSLALLLHPFISPRSTFQSDLSCKAPKEQL
jgi:hypothetical protein